MMKQLIMLILLGILLCVTAKAQNEKQELPYSFTHKVKGKVDIEELQDEEAQIIMDVAKDIKGLRVLVTDIDPKQYYKQARKLIKDDDGYEVLLTVKDKGDNVNFWIKEKGNIIEELFLLVGSDDEFVLVSFLGKLDLNKIAQLSDSIEMSGAKHLQKIGKSIEKGVEKNSN